MKLSKIKSKYILQELLSFLLKRRKFKIVKYNRYLINKLDLTINDYKELFLSERIKKYDFSYISTLWNEFQKDFKEILSQEKDLYNLFLNILSKNEDFILKLSDSNYDYMIKNIYFKENIRIKIDSLNKDIHLYEVDKIKNILQLMNNGKINKLCVLNIDDIFIKYLNQKILMKYLLNI